MDDDKYPRIIIQTRLADDRRRVHHVKQARIRSDGSAAAARNGHKQEVCVRNTRYRQAVRVQPAYRQPYKEKGKIDKAITQIGRKIIVDAELALELAGKKTGGRK